MKYCCSNCDYQTDNIDDLDEIQDLQQRVSVGEIYPAGECPECGALIGASHTDVIEAGTFGFVLWLLIDHNYTVEHNQRGLPGISPPNVETAILDRLRSTSNQGLTP